MKQIRLYTEQIDSEINQELRRIFAEQDIDLVLVPLNQLPVQFRVKTHQKTIKKRVS